MNHEYFPQFAHHISGHDIPPGVSADNRAYQSSSVESAASPVTVPAQTCLLAPSDHGQLPRKPKRSRTAFTAQQIEQLELEYKRNTYMHRPQRIHIAQRLCLHERIVKIWFQNRRTKEKKLQKSAGDKKPRSKPHNEQNAQQEIVQRLMSYSDPKAQQPEASPFYAQSKFRTTTPTLPLQMHPPPPPPLTPPPTPAATNSAAPEISQILSFLEGTSARQAPCQPSSQPQQPYDLDLIIQTIRKDLKQEAHQWAVHSQQQAMRVTPTINLSWGSRCPPPHPRGYRGVCL